MRKSFFLLLLCFAASAAPRNRIHSVIENGQRVALGGHIHPRADADLDLGPLSSTEALPRMTLVLRQTAEQQADLEKLLSDQQNPASPGFHHWLTPADYADRFGVSSDDIAKISAWLESQGLQVDGVARARNQIWFTGTTGAVAKAFGTQIHHYNINGQTHFANATEPTIPVALDAVIRSIHGLNDFKMQPKSFQQRTLAPDYTSGSSGNHYLSPGDIAAIYNLKPLHNAGIRGAGQKIVVAGQTQIDLTDLQLFRTKFGMVANDPDVILVPHTLDPGKVSGDLGEADLDIEWASAAAPEAKIVYVYSKDVMDAVQYAINENLAPVLSVSYGLCETLTARSDALTLQSWAQQANAQGITWINASGDSGGADCVAGTSTAGSGLSVDVPASIPEVTGLGGTTFAEGSGTYWASTNDTSGASALAYIPEMVWNDSTSQDPAAGGGGSSAMFAKPSWQTGTGVPDNTARNVPDVSLAASANHDGYMVYSAGKLSVYGGTSAGAPVFAGIATLLNQYLVANGSQQSAGLGNMNPKLYSLAQTNPAAFHDVTSGNNIVTVTCGARSRNCSPGSFGYQAGPGYDQASGLGSIDAYVLATSWRDQAGAVSRGTTSLALSTSAASITRSDSLTLTATVSSANGVSPQGTVSFNAGSIALGSAQLAPGASGISTATLRVSNSSLVTGANLISATYSGSDTLGGSTGSVTVSVVSNPTGTVSITGVTNAASFTQTLAPGMLVSVFGSELAPAIASASALPLPTQLSGVSVTINGLAAPLQFVSPGQVNLQIPYESPANSTVSITVNNNGRSVTTQIALTNAAPGIFADGNGLLVPAGSARRGDVIEMYFTGAGAVTPMIASGSAPSSGAIPKPMQAARFTVGGVDAVTQFVGISQGLVGAVQVNLVVPATAPAGAQQVIATIGGVASAPVILNVSAN